MDGEKGREKEEKGREKEEERGGRKTGKAEKMEGQREKEKERNSKSDKKAKNGENEEKKNNVSIFHMALDNETLSLPLSCPLPPHRLHHSAGFEPKRGGDGAGKERGGKEGDGKWKGKGALSKREYEIWMEADGQMLEGRAIKEVSCNSDLMFTVKM